MTHIKKAALAITVMLMAGCEAPLDLTAVEAMQAETTKRFDMYQDAAAVGDRVLITSSAGAALVSDDAGLRFDENHPISKRVHYVDAQTFTLPRTIVYDRKGDLWKSWGIGQAHPDHHMAKNKGTGVSIDDNFFMIDVQARHCTTGQFKGQVDPELNPVKLFTVQNMRATGR